MKLVSASVEGLFGEAEHRIDVNPEGISFVHAMNGVGKTMFLTLIFAILRVDMPTLNSIRFARSELVFKDGSRIVAEGDGSDIKIRINRGGMIKDYTSPRAQGIVPPTFITSSRLTTKKGDGTLVYSLDLFSEELRDMFAEARDDSAIDVDSAVIREEMDDSEIDMRLRELKAKIEFMNDSGFRVNIPIGLKMNPSRYDIGKNHERYLKLVRSLEDYLSKDQQLAESIVVYQDIINSFFAGKRLVINNGRMGILLPDGSSLPMDHLSSGEKHLLIIFYRLLFQCDNSSLVIIDEPEISLHISWQQKLGQVLSDLCRLRDLQMIIATHSPQTIHDMWDLANELR